MVFCCEVIVPPPEIPAKTFFELYAPVITSGVVILLFIFERFLSSYLRRKERRKEWYLKIIVEPKLADIDKFFEDVCNQLQESRRLLSAAAGGNHAAYLKAQAERNKAFGEKKREFEFQFLYMVRTFDTNVFSKVNAIILEVEDYYSVAIGATDINAVDMDSVISKIQLSKAQLYTNLYSPLK